MPRAQAVRRTVEVSSKILDGPDVVAYGMRREVTTLEFLQHHFSKMGHRDTSCDPHLYPSHQATTAPLPHAKRPPRSGYVLPTKPDKAGKLRQILKIHGQAPAYSMFLCPD